MIRPVMGTVFVRRLMSVILALVFVMGPCSNQHVHNVDQLDDSFRLRFPGHLVDVEDLRPSRLSEMVIPKGDYQGIRGGEAVHSDYFRKYGGGDKYDVHPRLLWGATTGRGNDDYPRVKQPLTGCEDCHHGRCVPSNPERQWATMADTEEPLEMVCKCDPGFSGPKCNRWPEAWHHFCSGHGVLDYENFSCECLDGWSLRDCSFGPTAPCLHNCSGNGDCWFNRCRCRPGWHGDDCSKVVVGCTKNCTGRGTCDHEAKLCSCMNGLKGRHCNMKPLVAGDEAFCPGNCSGWGDCIDGKCMCKKGYSGAECESIGPVCKGSCNGHGLCWTGAEVCECSNGFFGDDCSRGPHFGSTCPGNCHGRGDCVNGTCYCITGFHGPDCSRVAKVCLHSCSAHGVCWKGQCICDSGYTGEDCSTAILQPEGCPSSCSGNGICVSGACRCAAGWTGLSCDTVVVAGCSQNCSAHGLCAAAMDSSSCECDQGYGSSYECSIGAITHTCARNCSGRGECILECDIDGRCDEPYCRCFPPWRGPLCMDGGPSPSPSPRPADCPNGCSGHGACLAKDEIGHRNMTLRMELQYVHRFTFPRPGIEPNISSKNPLGPDMYVWPKACLCDICYTGFDCSSYDDNDCLTQCTEDDVACGPGGLPVGVRPDCRCSYPLACTASDIDCGPRGKPQGNVGNCSCECEAGVSGPFCDLGIECGPEHINCGPHGDPAGVTDECMCVCHAGFEGDYCEFAIATPTPEVPTPAPLVPEPYVEEIGACPHACSGHGTCLLGICVCDRDPEESWTGISCDKVGKRCPDDCNGRGKCNDEVGICECFAGYSGLSCDKKIEQCHLDCSSHGCVCLDASGDPLVPQPPPPVIDAKPLSEQKQTVAQRRSCQRGWCRLVYPLPDAEPQDGYPGNVNLTDEVPPAAINATLGPTAKTADIGPLASPPRNGEGRVHAGVIIPVPNEMETHLASKKSELIRLSIAESLGVDPSQVRILELEGGSRFEDSPAATTRRMRALGLLEHHVASQTLVQQDDDLSQAGQEETLPEHFWEVRYFVNCSDSDVNRVYSATEDKSTGKIADTGSLADQLSKRLDYEIPYTGLTTISGELPPGSSYSSDFNGNAHEAEYPATNEDAESGTEEPPDADIDEIAPNADEGGSEEQESDEEKEARAEARRLEDAKNAHQRVREPEPVAACPNECSGHGNCVPAPPLEGVQCQCHETSNVKYIGEDCSVPFFGCNHLDGCNERAGRGVCINGTCGCNVGWGGKTCAEHDQDCPRNCAKHGQCQRNLGQCDCDQEGGYEGDDCTIDRCRDPPCVWGFGWAEHGQLGLGELSSRSEIHPAVYANSVLAPRFLRRMDGRSIASVTCGERTCFALDEDGGLYGWGDNSKYQLCVGNRDLHMKPVKIPFFGNGQVEIKQIAVGENHTLFLLGDGRVFGCGTSMHQLGVITTFDENERGSENAKFPPLDDPDRDEEGNAMLSDASLIQASAPHLDKDRQQHMLVEEVERVSRGQVDVPPPPSTALGIDRRASAHDNVTLIDEEHDPDHIAGPSWPIRPNQSLRDGSREDRLAHVYGDGGLETPESIMGGGSVDDEEREAAMNSALWDHDTTRKYQAFHINRDELTAEERELVGGDPRSFLPQHARDMVEGNGQSILQFIEFHEATIDAETLDDHPDSEEIRGGRDDLSYLELFVDDGPLSQSQGLDIAQMLNLEGADAGPATVLPSSKHSEEWGIHEAPTEPQDWDTSDEDRKLEVVSTPPGAIEPDLLVALDSNTTKSDLAQTYLSNTNATLPGNFSVRHEEALGQDLPVDTNSTNRSVLDDTVAGMDKLLFEAYETDHFVTVLAQLGLNGTGATHMVNESFDEADLDANTTDTWWIHGLSADEHPSLAAIDSSTDDNLPAIDADTGLGRLAPDFAAEEQGSQDTNIASLKTLPSGLPLSADVTFMARGKLLGEGSLDAQTLLAQSGGAGADGGGGGGDGGAGGEDEGSEDGDKDAEKHELRVTDGKQGTVAAKEACEFPFSFKGKKYTACTTDKSPDPAAEDGDEVKEWCGTVEDVDADVEEKNKWGTCAQKEEIPEEKDKEPAGDAAKSEGMEAPTEENQEIFDVPDDVIPIPKSLVNINAIESWAFVAASATTSAAIGSTGALYTWGTNTFGQLGHGHNDDSIYPVMIKGRLEELVGKECTYVAVCERHSLAVFDGLVYAWGDNEFGQLGIKSTENHVWPQFVKVLDDKTIASVYCGDRSSYALSDDNFIYSWGANDKGQLGLAQIGPNNFADRPVLIDYPFVRGLCGTKDKGSSLCVPVDQMSCGSTHCIVKSAAGDLYTFGSNEHGELGSNKWAASETARQMQWLTRDQEIQSVATGRWFTVVVSGKPRPADLSTALSQDIRAKEAELLQMAKDKIWTGRYVRRSLAHQIWKKMSWINRWQPEGYYQARDCRGPKYKTYASSQVNMCRAYAGPHRLNDNMRSVWVPRFTIMVVRHHCHWHSAHAELVATKSKPACINIGGNRIVSWGSSYFWGWWTASHNPFPVTLHASGDCSFDLPPVPKPRTYNCWSKAMKNMFIHCYPWGRRFAYWNLNHAKRDCVANWWCAGVTYETWRGWWTLRGCWGRAYSQMSWYRETSMKRVPCGEQTVAVSYVQCKTGGLVDMTLLRYADYVWTAHGYWGGGWRHAFVLRKGEYLNKVIAYQGWFMHAIRFRTNKGRWSRIYGPGWGRGHRAVYSSGNGQEIWDIIDAGRWCPPIVGVHTRKYQEPPGLEEKGYVKLLQDAQYGGKWEKAHRPLASGAFSELVAVYKKGGVWCSHGWARHWSSRRNPWMMCGPRFAFELKINGRYVVAQWHPLLLPRNCRYPSQSDGDIHCNVFFTVRMADILTPTWLEPARRRSTGDNGGTITIDLYGMPYKGHSHHSSGWGQYLGHTFFQESRRSIMYTVGSMKLCAGCQGYMWGWGGYLAALEAAGESDECKQVQDPNSVYFWSNYEGPLVGGRPHGIVFHRRTKDGLRHMTASIRNGDMPKREITLEAWVRLVQYQRWSAPVQYIQDDGRREAGVGLVIHGWSICFVLTSKGRQRISYMCSRARLWAYHWYHVAGTYDGRRMRLYINGRLHRSEGWQHGDIQYPPSDYTPKKGGSLFTVGAYHDANEYYPFLGNLAEIRMWGVRRKDWELRAYMRRFLKGSEGGLLQYWPFMETRGNWVRSRRSGGKSLQSHGGPFARVNFDRYVR